MNYSEFFTNRPTEEIAKDLLGRTLSFNNGQEILAGTIVETEAYLGPQDRAAHSYNGRRSQANEGLYCPGGHLYIYSQRQYFFFDVATQEKDNPQGVLVRAIEPTAGLETMIKNRNGKDGRLVTNGPGKMMQAFGIHSRKWDLAALKDSPFTIDLANKRQIEEILPLPRVGINQSDPKWANKKLRYVVAGNPFVSDIKKKDIKLNHGFDKN